MENLYRQSSAHQRGGLSVSSQYASADVSLGTRSKLMQEPLNPLLHRSSKVAKGPVACTLVGVVGEFHFSKLLLISLDKGCLLRLCVKNISGFNQLMNILHEHTRRLSILNKQNH